MPPLISRLEKRMNSIQHIEMIEHIDDIINILKEENNNTSDAREIVYLIHKHDNLEAVLWQLYAANFRPQIKYQSGNISHMYITVNNKVFILKSQQLIHSDIDGLIEIDTAENATGQMQP
jgi:hypothetical protein